MTTSQISISPHFSCINEHRRLSHSQAYLTNEKVLNDLTWLNPFNYDSFNEITSITLYIPQASTGPAGLQTFPGDPAGFPPGRLYATISAPDFS
jgi:hypothetical protein